MTFKELLPGDLLIFGDNYNTIDVIINKNHYKWLHLEHIHNQGIYLQTFKHDPYEIIWADVIRNGEIIYRAMKDPYRT